MGIAPLRDAIASLIDKPLVALASHRHSDHVGGLHEFETRVAHPDDAEHIAHPASATLSTASFPADFKRQMADDGHPFGDLLIDALPHAGYDPATYAIAPAPPTRLVGEGDVVDLGDRALVVLHLPGHTPGSIGLWEEATGILFSGDAIYDGLLFDFLPESDIADYVATMRRLRDLPVTVVHGGHEPSFGRERMQAIIDEYVARRANPG
jgi:glyoxylase-like metal-dependent hydrolase (beta-lactamase superfamily II)